MSSYELWKLNFIFETHRTFGQKDGMAKRWLSVKEAMRGAECEEYVKHTLS